MAPFDRPKRAFDKTTLFTGKGMLAQFMDEAQVVGVVVMAFSEFEIKRYEKAVAAFVQKRRPAPHIRDKVDMAFRIKDQSVEIYLIRPHWQDAHRTIEESIAKTTYNRRSGNWKIFWKRADLKWHGYTPRLLVASIDEFLDVVDEDEYNCFFG